MSAVIRRARLEDADRLPEIERSAGALFRTVPDLAWIADDRVLSADDHRDFIVQHDEWVAESDGALAGFLAARRYDRELHIVELAVRAERQGRGVGRKLMDAAIAHARDAGCTAVTLTTFRDVAWNEGFYARLGFRTLDPAALSPRLLSTLREEAEAGLPASRRCAMRLALI